MNTSLKFLLTSIAAASLVACGGGSETAPTAATTPTATTPTATTATTPTATTPTATGTAPVPTSTPTAVLQATQAEADKLAAEAKAGLAGANSASAAGSLPLGVETAALPSGVVQDVSAYMCKTGTASIDVPGTAPAAGYKMTGTFNNCALTSTGFVFGGSYSVAYSRYVGPTDFSVTATFTNFTFTGAGLTNQTYNGTVTCDYKGAINYTNSCYYSDGSRAWSGTVTYSGNAATGTYTANYGSGTIKVAYNKFGSAGGTATITGSNGYSAVITWNSATSYNVVVTANGTSSTFTSAV